MGTRRTRRDTERPPSGAGEIISRDRDDQKPLIPTLPEMQAVGRTPDGRVAPHEFNAVVARVVAQLAANGANADEIARILNLRPGTLRKHYWFELDNGTLHANMSVATALYVQAARVGNVRATEIWLKARAGWRETDDKNADRSPLSIIIHNG